MSLGTTLLYGDPVGFETLTPTVATGISVGLLTSSDDLQAQTALVTVRNSSCKVPC